MFSVLWLRGRGVGGLSWGGITLSGYLTSALPDDTFMSQTFFGTVHACQGKGVRLAVIHARTAQRSLRLVVNGVPELWGKPQEGGSAGVLPRRSAWSWTVGHTVRGGAGSSCGCEPERGWADPTGGQGGVAGWPRRERTADARTTDSQAVTAVVRHASGSA